MSAWLKHVMDGLADAHQNVVDNAYFVESREMTPDECELIRKIDAAFLHAQVMRSQDVQTHSV